MRDILIRHKDMITVAAVLLACLMVGTLAGNAQGDALAALPDDAVLVYGDYDYYYMLQQAPVVDSLVADYECDCWRLASTRERLIIVWSDILLFDVLSEPYTRDRFVATSHLSYNRLAVFVSQPRPAERVYGDWHGASAFVVEVGQ